MINVLAFLINFTTGMLIISYPLVAIERFGVSALTLGALGTTSAGAYALACLVSGTLVDRIGFKKMVMAACALLALVYPSILLIDGIGQLFLMAVFGSIGLSLFWPAVMRWIGEEEHGDLLRKQLGSFSIALIAGIMVGNFVAGKLFELSPAAPYLLSALTALAVLLLVLFTEEKNTPGGGADQPAPRVQERPRPGFLLIGWIANFAVFFAVGVGESLFPKLALKLGISVPLLASLVAMIPLGQIFLFVLLRRTHRWHFKYPPLLLLQLLGLMGLLLLTSTSRSWIFGLAFLFLGACAGMTYFSSIFYSVYRQEGKGRKSGFHEAFLGGGVAVGPICGGLIARSFDLRAPYWLCIVLMGISLVVQIGILKSNQSKKNKVGLEDK